VHGDVMLAGAGPGHAGCDAMAVVTGAGDSWEELWQEVEDST
jgi:hypothetical protein